MSRASSPETRRQVVPFSAGLADRKLLAELSKAMGGAGVTAVIRQALKDAAAVRLPAQAEQERTYAPKS